MLNLKKKSDLSIFARISPNLQLNLLSVKCKMKKVMIVKICFANKLLFKILHFLAAIYTGELLLPKDNEINSNW